MRHRGLLTVSALGLILGLIFAGIVLAGPASLSLDYRGNVNVAIEWFGTNTPANSSILSITDPAFGSINQSYPGHSGFYDLWASESPYTATFTALEDGAHYLAVTNLQDNGSSYATNFAWRNFNSTTLEGAALVYSDKDTHIFCLVTSC